MTQVRRVTRRFNAPRTSRPVTHLAPPPATVVSPVFRHSEGLGGARIENLFFDLDQPTPTAKADPRAQKARARLSRYLTDERSEDVSNIFADNTSDEGEGPDTLDLRLTSMITAQPRKMQSIRSQMAEAHAARQAKARVARYPTAKEVIGVAAGVIVAMIFMPLPPIF